MIQITLQVRLLLFIKKQVMKNFYMNLMINPVILLFGRQVFIQMIKQAGFVPLLMELMDREFDLSIPIVHCSLLDMQDLVHMWVELLASLILQIDILTLKKEFMINLTVFICSQLIKTLYLLLLLLFIILQQIFILSGIVLQIDLGFSGVYILAYLKIILDQ